MQNFHISGPSTGGTFRFTNISVDTAIDAGVAAAKVTTSKGITNPGYILTTGALGPASFFDRTKTNTVTGTGSGALDTAVKALHELGDANGVTGISLSTDSDLVGGVMLASKPGVFLTNSAETKAIGAPALRAIDDAARTVLGLALTSN
jgi:hypothetical protein